MRLMIAIVSFAGGLAVCYLLFSVGIVQKPAGIPTIPNDQTQTISVYLSFVGVMLTAVTTILTAMAIGIGIIAAYTFAGLKTEAGSVAKNTAKEVSESTAREVASDALSDVKIKGFVEACLAINIRQTERDAEWGPDEREEEER